MRLPGFLLAAGTLTGSVACCQSTVMADFNPLSAGTSGVHLYGASISGAYFSGGYGIGLRSITPEFAASDVGMVQGSIVLGWSRQRQKSNISMVYSPSYVRGINMSSYHSLNHSFSLTGGKTLTSKWDLAFAASAIVNDFSQLLFGRPQAANITSVPSTFEDFFNAVMTGRSANASLTQAVVAAPLANSPETAFLYGDRLLTTSVSVSASYAYSSRSVFRVGLHSSRSQQFRHGSNLPEQAASFSIPKTTAGSVDLSWSYSLTPRTTLGINASTTRTFSVFQDAYSNQANVAFGRTMSRNWFVNGMIGMGFITPVREIFAPMRQAQTQFGGGLGYKVYSSTFLGSFTRAVSDIYGLGANTMDMSSGAWAWKRPGRSISVSATAGYSKLNGPSFPNAGSWMANASFGKALTSHLALSIGGSYTQFPRSVFVVMPNITQKGVVVSLSWSPSERR